MLGPARLEVDPVGAELVGARCLGGAVEDGSLPCDLETLEPGSRDLGLELCFQQSAGDSAGPEVDVLLGSVRDLLLHHDVGDLQPAAGLEHAEPLGKGG
jgi:hypothetical protein